MPCDSIVRSATPADRKEIWRLALMGHREGGIFTLAPQKVNFFIQRALYPELIPWHDTGPRGVIGVIGPANAIEAVVFATIEEMWYSTEKFIDEKIVDVDRECRNTMHARTLIAWLKQQVVETGIPLITGVVSTDRNEAKCRLYRKVFPKGGEFFIVRPNGPIIHRSSAAYIQ